VEDTLSNVFDQAFIISFPDVCACAREIRASPFEDHLGMRSKIPHALTLQPVVAEIARWLAATNVSIVMKELHATSFKVVEYQKLRMNASIHVSLLLKFGP
jgi:hypothetical protein